MKTFAIWCCGETHKILFRRGRMILRGHTDAEVRAALAAEALGGKLPMCVSLLAFWREPRRETADFWDATRPWKMAGPDFEREYRARLDQRLCRSPLGPHHKPAWSTAVRVAGVERDILKRLLGEIGVNTRQLDCQYASDGATVSLSDRSVFFQHRWGHDVYLAGLARLDGSVVLSVAPAPGQRRLTSGGSGYDVLGIRAVRVFGSAGFRYAAVVEGVRTKDGAVDWRGSTMPRDFVRLEGCRAKENVL